MTTLPTAERVALALRASGYARLGQVLSRKMCEDLRGAYDDEENFRSTINMERYRFGRGQYRYLRYPLPQQVQSLREALYELLVPAAREWCALLRMPAEYPGTLKAFLKVCRASGQKRPTPLLLRYRAGDYNCLHQDLYGERMFPFQVIVGLSEPGREYEGGELLLVEQRPRAQSVGQALTLAQGEAVAITTRYRPVEGSRGVYRTNIRHGVSPLIRGERFTLGVIFHDAV